MDPQLEFVIIGLIVFLGALIQGSLGFGIGVLLVPFLLLVASSYVPAMPLLISLPVIIASLIRDRHYVEVPSFLWLTAGRLPGTVLGSLLLAFLPETGVRLLAACVLLVITVLMLTSRSRGVDHRQRGGAGRLVVGSLSGFMATSSGVGGPVLAIAFRDAEPQTMRATINATTLVGALMSLTGILLAGRLGTAQLTAAGLMLIPALLGLSLSGRLTRLLRKEHMGTIVTLSILVCCLLVFAQLGLQAAGVMD